MNRQVVISELRSLLREHDPDARYADYLLDQLEADLPRQPMLGVPRHKDWERVAAEFLADNPACAACGTKKLLQVHHKVPFHLRPELELDRGNLIALCDQSYHHCHFVVGHLMNWSCYNPDVEEDAARLLEKIRHRAS